MVTPESPTHRAASQTRWRKPMVLASPTGAHAKTSTRRDPGAVTSVSLSGCTGYTAYLRYGVSPMSSKFVSFSYFALLSFNAVYSIQLYIAVHYTTSTTPLVSSWLVPLKSLLSLCQGTHKAQGGLSKNTLHKYSVPRCGVRILLRAHQSHRLDSRSSLPA